MCDLNIMRSVCENVRFEGGEDRWVWALDDNDIFSVASLRRALDDMSLRRCSPPTNWLKSVPIKVRFLSCRVKLDKLPTKENLLKKGIAFTDVLCPLCNSVLESKAHVFNDYGKVTEVKSLLNSWWRLFPEDDTGIHVGRREGRAPEVMGIRKL